MRRPWIVASLLVGASWVRAAKAPHDLVAQCGEEVIAARQDGAAWLLRERSVPLASEAIATSDAIRLNLFSDVNLLARTTRVERRARGGYTWFGAIDGDGTAVLVVNGSRVAGSIRHLGHLYGVAYQHGGDHLVSEVDPTSYPPEGEPLAPVSTSAPPVGEAVDDGSILDVLIVYTDDVAAKVADIDGLAQLAVDETNLAYERSGILPRLRLVDLRRIDYDESSNGYTDIDRLTRPTDGLLDEVHAWRDDCAADVVSMWLEDLGYGGLLCGLGWEMTTISPAFATNAFNVVRRGCAVGGFTFAHECGHNFGAHHDRPNASGPGATPYAYGYNDCVGNFSTIMAYGTCAFGPRIPHFSNPDVFYAGRRTGTPHSDAEPTDNARTINETAATTAAFRDSSTGCCLNDVAEPDDTCTAAKLLLLGSAEARNFCDRSADWFVFDTCADGTYNLATTALEPAAHTRLELYNADCSVRLAVDEESGPGGASSISFVSWLGERYVARASQSDGSFGRNHGYELLLTGDVSRCSSCGDGQRDAWEECDDGGTAPCDGCNEYCEAERCGDGIVACGEECDDGGIVPGDGCDAVCQRESTSCLPADLGVVRPLTGVKAAAARANFSWSADVGAREYHLTTVGADRRLLVDPRSSGFGAIECVATAPITSCTVAAVRALGVRYYQAIAACDGVREGPF